MVVDPVSPSRSGKLRVVTRSRHEIYMVRLCRVADLSVRLHAFVFRRCKPVGWFQNSNQTMSNTPFVQSNI